MCVCVCTHACKHACTHAHTLIWMYYFPLKIMQTLYSCWSVMISTSMWCFLNPVHLSFSVACPCDQLKPISHFHQMAPCSPLCTSSFLSELHMPYIFLHFCSNYSFHVNFYFHDSNSSLISKNYGKHLLLPKCIHA